GAYSAIGNYTYGYNGMEKDDELKGSGKLYSTLFREGDTENGRWWSRDPKETNFVSDSPYIMVGSNPISYIDPDGLEKVGVVGGPDDVNANENNFYDTGLLQFDNYLDDTEETGEKVTMIFFNSSDNKKEISQAFSNVAGDRKNYDLIFVNTAQELTTYLNHGTVAPLKDNPRLKDPITSLSFFGHGRNSTFEPGYSNPFSSTTSQIWGINEAGKLKSSAFDKNACVYLFSCRAAENGDGLSINLAQKIFNVTNAEVIAWKSKTSYYDIYKLKPESTTEWLEGVVKNAIGVSREIRKADFLPKGLDGAKPLIFKNDEE
ncbi:MAG: RHS repeat-associated core domain-containing protein, partial [Candidatus Kapaibacterium sp.]